MKKYEKGKRYRFGGYPTLYEATFNGMQDGRYLWKDIALLNFPSEYEKIIEVPAFAQETVLASEQNYSLVTKENPKMHLDAVTFEPTYEIDMMLKIKSDVLHGGHFFNDTEIRMQEQELVENIMNKLRVVVVGLVTKANPYEIHRY